jgi:peptidyl-prolyl cis-trans isomerase C
MYLNVQKASGAMWLLATLLALGACEQGHGARASQKPEDLQDALAKIDDVIITVGEFQERINQQTPYVRSRYTSLERKKEFLDNLVRLEVLAKEAERRGLNKDPEVVRAMKQTMITKLLKDEFDRLKMEDVSDGECKKYFDTHPEIYNKPEEVRVSMILVKDAATAKKVLADARIKGVDNQGYRNLVTEYSLDLATKDRGGDLRYFDAKTKDVPREIVDAAFKLQNIGDVSEPIKTAQGVVLLKSTGRRRAEVRTFDVAKQSIRMELFRQKRSEAMETFIKNLREKAAIKVDEGKLAKVRIEGVAAGEFPGPGVPPPGPGQFHPGAPGVPQATPATPGQPASAAAITLPPPGSPQAPPPPGATPPPPVAAPAPPPTSAPSPSK